MIEIKNYVLAQFLGAFGAVMSVSAFLFPMLAAELIVPGRKLHLPTTLFNAVYVFFYLIVSGIILSFMVPFFKPLIPANLLGWSAADNPAWKNALYIALYVVVFDFLYYWFHRAQHTFGWMWNLHRFHHADKCVAALTATRHHWTEEFLRYFVMFIPILFLFGSPEHALPWLGLTLAILGIFIHWDVNLPLGPLTKVVVGPQYHRIHHSIHEKHYNKNFAVLFPFWDKLFGTQCLPQGSEFPETGLCDVDRSNSLKLLLPVPPAKI